MAADMEVAGARVGHNGNNSAVCLIQHAIGWSHEEVVIASPFVLPAIFERKLPLTSGAFSQVWLVVAPPYCLSTRGVICRWGIRGLTRNSWACFLALSFSSF